MKDKDVFKLGKYELRRNCMGKWDFYCEYGADGDVKRCTQENFEMVIVEGSLVKVYKQISFDQFGWGLYNTDAKLVLPIQWGEIIIFPSDITRKPAYLLLKDYAGFWGVGNIDGSIILSPSDFAGVRWKRDNEKEYVDLIDRNGKEMKYEVTENGLKFVS